MKEFNRDYQEYLRGFVRGASLHCSYTNGGLGVGFLNVKTNETMQKAVSNSLLENNWSSDEIPTLHKISKGELLVKIDTVYRGAVKSAATRLFAESIVSILDDEFGKKYDIYAGLCDADDYGQSIVFIVEIVNERILIVFSWSYD